MITPTMKYPTLAPGAMKYPTLGEHLCTLAGGVVATLILGTIAFALMQAPEPQGLRIDSKGTVVVVAPYTNGAGATH